MDDSRKNQVSLRGASAREISRDALLEKVSQERELRSYARKATVAAIFIQKIWRRYFLTKKVALKLQEEWKMMVANQTLPMSGTWISNVLLRNFLYFVTYLSTRRRKLEAEDIYCMRTCFKILLDSISSTDLQTNFCSLAFGTVEERRLWLYQSQKLISLCLFILGECDISRQSGLEITSITSLAMRLAVVLTDLKGWKCITGDDLRYADTTLKDLIQYTGSKESGLYNHVRKYILNLDVPFSSRKDKSVPADDLFLITASALTLSLRPIHMSKFNDFDKWNESYGTQQYCVFILTIPWLVQRIPAALLPALQHNSVLSPCFKTILMLEEKLLNEIQNMDQSKVGSQDKVMPQVGWLLANMLWLSTVRDTITGVPTKFAQGLDQTSYVQVVIFLCEKLVSRLQYSGRIRNENQELEDRVEASAESIDSLFPGPVTCQSLKMSYINFYKPVHQQWHLLKLLAMEKDDPHQQINKSLPSNSKSLGKSDMLYVAYFYSYMIRIFSLLNPVLGSLPVLNLLSFTPGFLTTLWAALEKSLFPYKTHIGKDSLSSGTKSYVSTSDGTSQRNKSRVAKHGATKWASVLSKLTGKADSEYTESADFQIKNNQGDEESSGVWDIETLRQGPEAVSKDTSCLIHLFAASYSHLLLVLDDIEFYEKQVPFTLERQRRIAAMLNTLVYNALSQNISVEKRPLMDAAIRCLHLLYERDCRHQFCPPDLWLSPAKTNRPPIAAAARSHEVLSATLRSDDSYSQTSMGNVITVTPHVFPFEERVQMFREFINMDKTSRRMAGEVLGPGSRTVEIVIRRGHVVEDGFRQLNSLGSRLKSNIHVSFVSESGLPEVGLDYGGLSKEFLTDLAKAAFAPEYGLFSQTSTSDRLIIPTTAARFQENGVQMIEFLGKVVGKALYEGILLDYSFSHVFVHKLLGRYSFLDELSTLDPELYKNLMYLKNYDGDAKELCLDFTVTEESFGKMHVIELKPDGKDMCVTNDNKLQYIHAMADYKLNRQILPLSNAFYRGLTDLIAPSWMKLFNASEFNQLLSGGKHDIDVDDLKNNTRYTGGYTEGSRTIKIFWEVLAGFEPKDRCMLLKFVTSCSRAPLLGFKYLQPAFTIHKVTCEMPLWASFGGQDVERLPSASTCYNTLKLPTYKRANTLRAKLLYAINSNAGFELS